MTEGGLLIFSASATNRERNVQSKSRKKKERRFPEVYIYHLHKTKYVHIMNDGRRVGPHCCFSDIISFHSDIIVGSWFIILRGMRHEAHSTHKRNRGKKAYREEKERERDHVIEIYSV